MTYVEVPAAAPPTAPRRAGRPHVEVPPALLAQLQHSAATGAQCVIERDGSDQEIEDIAELRRHITRVRYKNLIPGRKVRLRVTPKIVTYFVEPDHGGSS